MAASNPRRSPSAPPEQRAASRDLLDRAQNYPYELEQHSYVLVGQNVLRLAFFDCQDLGGSQVVFDHEKPPLHEVVHALGMEPSELAAQRTALLAFGSNASPHQLRKKFDSTPNTILPVLTAQLRDLDIVYSAHFSRYGAIPASLLTSPGTTVSAFVTYLTESQLQRMHSSEAQNYDVVELRDLDLRIDGMDPISSIQCYLSHHGSLQRHGTAVRLQAFAASNPRYPALSEEDLLREMASIYFAGGTTAGFIEKLVDDPDYREDITKQLRVDALRFEWPNMRLLKRLKPSDEDV